MIVMGDLHTETCHHSTESHVSCVHRVPLFQSLTEEQMEKIHSLIQHKSYARKEIIYRPGDTADSLYVVNSGKVRIYRLSETGKEQLIRMVLPGEFTGELALFKEGICEAYAEAMTDSNICKIRHKDFHELLIEHPAISVEMLTRLAKRLGTSEQQTAWVTTETVRSRLSHFLINLADSAEEQPIVELAMTKKDLASYLGTTSESLSRELSKLEKNNLIEEVAQGEIKLLKLEKLEFV